MRMKTNPETLNLSMHAYASIADIDCPPTGCRENLLGERKPGD
jgi:hypothetical protein